MTKTSEHRRVGLKLIGTIIDYVFGPLIVSNKKTWESEEMVKTYTKHTYLEKPEETILNILKSKLSDMKMLDVGVGAGRTTHYFGQLTKQYVGIDYSQKMIEECRRKFGNHQKKISFELCDVRSLQLFENSSFDFVLFSFNGLDNMNHEDRLRALREIRRVIRKGGYFCFSTLNFRDRADLSARARTRFRKSSRNPLKLMSVAYYLLLEEVLNRNALKRARSEGHALFNDGRYMIYYSQPKEQIRQLTESGFAKIRVYGLLDGKEIIESSRLESATDHYLHYLCIVD
jgi:ubiquinone/menaquinone biosynthesis C-methylase UbiE